MENFLPQTVGIDISKATLDVFAHPAGCERQFANSAKGAQRTDKLAHQMADRADRL